MTGQEHQGLTILEWLGVFGSFASIISIIINVIQGLKRRELKRQLESVVFSAEGTLSSVQQEADNALTSHSVGRESSLRAIQAHAKTGKDTLSQFRKRFLKIERY